MCPSGGERRYSGNIATDGSDTSRTGNCGGLCLIFSDGNPELFGWYRAVSLTRSSFFFPEEPQAFPDERIGPRRCADLRRPGNRPYFSSALPNFFKAGLSLRSRYRPGRLVAVGLKVGFVAVRPFG
jgi:hypothetical protein